MRLERRSQKVFIINKVKRINKWTKEEDNILLYYANIYDCKQWNKVCEFMKGRSQNQCLARYMRLKPGIKKGFWSLQEDELLKKAVSEEGKNWGRVAKYFENRNGKQCRDRYLNHLDPNISLQKFSPDEDKKILSLYKIYGNSWCQISTYFNNKRTPERIKNRFYSSLQKIVHKNDYNKSLESKYKKKSTTSETISINTPSNVFDSKEKLINKKDYSMEDFFIDKNFNYFNYNNDTSFKEEMELNCLNNFFCLS